MKWLRPLVLLVFGLLFTASLHVRLMNAQAPDSARGKKNSPPRKAKATPQLSGAEKGLFKIVVDGEPKGTEEFEISPAGDQFVAQGTIHLTVVRGDKPVQYLIESNLVLKSNFEPVRYTLVQKYEGNTATAKLDFQKGKASATFNTGSGSEQREYQLAPDVTLLDDNIFHHYVLLVRHYDFEKGGLQEFSAFIPQESIGGILRMTYPGEEKIDLHGKSVAVQHLIADTGDLKMDLYVEVEGHRLVKLEVPSSHVVVTREQ